MEGRVLPSDEVSAVLSANFACLKVNIDSPPVEVKKFLDQVQGQTLPFYAYVTPDGKFIHGTSGFRAVEAFKQDLDKALRSDAMRAPPEVEKKLVQLATQAEKDLEAKRYGAVQRAAKDAEKVKGFSDARVRLQEMQGKALAALRQALDETAALAKDGKLDDALVSARRQLNDFRGTEVEAASVTAVKSIERLKAAAGNAEKGDKAGARHVYQLIQKEAPDSPYAAIAAERLKGLE
jgi:hypothetical protein